METSMVADARPLPLDSFVNRQPPVITLVVDVIIPALDEAQAIGRVLGEVPGWVRQVVVVNNGSHDNTAALASAAGAQVVLEERRGYGYACLAGLAALDAPDVVVFLDGDYSDYPAEMIGLVQPICAGQADLVIGSRMAGRRLPGSMLWHAILGNRILAWLIRRITGCQVTDIGPFRAVTWECLQALDLKEGRYGWTLEMMLKAANQSYRMVEAPVSYRPRLGRSKVSGSPVASLKASLVMLATVARYARC
jgi:glycosyltransferase involved in cell wall biosynthesis